MGYVYDEHRHKLFTDEGQRQFLRIRDRVKRLLKEAGAVRINEAIAHESGDSWMLIACVDRMVEIGEIRRVAKDRCFDPEVFVADA